MLIIRNCGPVGYPGSAEVVNMQPPAALLKRGIDALPTMGDGRQSGTSGSPSILNVSPEAAVGGGLALLRTGDRIRIDLNTRKVDVLLPPGELEARRAAWVPPKLANKTPWEEIYRSMVGQLGTGGVPGAGDAVSERDRDPRARPQQPLGLGTRRRACAGRRCRRARASVLTAGFDPRARPGSRGGAPGRGQAVQVRNRPISPGLPPGKSRIRAARPNPPGFSSRSQRP